MGIPPLTIKMIQGNVLYFAILFTISVTIVIAEPEVAELENGTASEKALREGKVLPVFQVVKFPNDVCAGSTRNGTCYTAEECSNKGGTNDGSCASGFGVCCMFALSCGGSASENQTYIVQTSVTSLTSPCIYSICPCSTNICRIRYDFETFVLAAAVAGTTSSGAVPAAGSQIGPSLGDCVTDQFSIMNGYGGGSPIICGTNTGYHMIIDSDGTNCQEVNANIGANTGTARQYTVRITQYACGDYDNSGWPGCLQYYSESTGSVQNFAFPTGITTSTAASTTTSGVTHLQNQRYTVCFRRNFGSCYICYSPTQATADHADEATQDSFGLSKSNAVIALSQTGTLCSEDWIEIPDATTQAIALLEVTTGPAKAAITSLNRICGRYFETTNADATTATICSASVPFVLHVNFDNYEAHDQMVENMAQNNEQSEAPGGIVGFKLNFWQRSC